MARALIVTILLMVVATASWYAATSLERQDWEAEVDELKSEIGSLQEQIEAIESIVPTEQAEPVPTFAERRAAIIQFSQELIPICDSPNADSIMLLYLRSDILGPRIYYSEPVKAWELNQIRQCTNVSSRLSGLALELTEMACISEMQPIVDAFVAGLWENRQMVDSIDIQSRDGVIVHSKEEEQAVYAQTGRCLAHLAEAERLYDSACELWQSVLDQYAISYSEIGLSEPLLKPEDDLVDFCGREYQQYLKTGGW